MPSDPIYSPHLPSSSSSMRTSSWAGSPLMSSPSSSYSSSGSCTSWSSLAAGLCAGLAAGAALALIYTPMRGTEMRRSLSDAAARGGERLSELLEGGRCLAEDAISQASAAIEEGRRAFQTRSSGYGPSSSYSTSSYTGSSEPLTASVAEITGLDGRFEEPLGG